MNISTIFFFKILAKYSPKRTKLHDLKKFSWENMPPNLPSTLRAMQILFKKYFESPHEMKSLLLPVSNYES